MVGINCVVIWTAACATVTNYNVLIIPQISVGLGAHVSRESFILSASHLACELLKAQGSAVLNLVQTGDAIR